MYKIFLGIILSYLLSGCTPSLKFVDNPTCKSVIEGYYGSHLRWTGRVPALIYKDKGKTKAAYGQVCENGDFFEVSQVSKKQNDSTLIQRFPKAKTIAIIDSARKIIYGHMNDNILRPKEYWNLFLEVAKMNVKHPRVKEIRLIPGKNFAFCLTPGRYVIKEMYFVNKQQIVDMAKNFPELTFKVTPYSTTYIGNLYLDDPRFKSNRIEIPYINISNPNDSAALGFIGGTAGGAIGGAIAGALLNLAKRAAIPKKKHILQIVNNPSFSPKAKLNFKVGLLKVKENKH